MDIAASSSHLCLTPAGEPCCHVCRDRASMRPAQDPAGPVWALQPFCWQDGWQPPGHSWKEPGSTLAPATSLPFPVTGASRGRGPWARPQRIPRPGRRGQGQGTRGPACALTPAQLRPRHQPRQGTAGCPPAPPRPRGERGTPAEARSEALAAQAGVTPCHPRRAAGPGRPGPSRGPRRAPAAPPPAGCPAEPPPGRRPPLQEPPAPWRGAGRGGGAEDAGLTGAGRAGAVSPCRRPGGRSPLWRRWARGAALKPRGAEPALPPPSHWLRGQGRRGGARLPRRPRPLRTWGPTRGGTPGVTGTPGTHRVTESHRDPRDPRNAQGSQGPPGPSEPSRAPRDLQHPWGRGPRGPSIPGGDTRGCRGRGGYRCGYR